MPSCSAVGEPLIWTNTCFRVIRKSWDKSGQLNRCTPAKKRHLGILSGNNRNAVRILVRNRNRLLPQMGVCASLEDTPCSAACMTDNEVHRKTLWAVSPIFLSYYVVVAGPGHSRPRCAFDAGLRTQLNPRYPHCRPGLLLMKRDESR